MKYLRTYLKWKDACAEKGKTPTDMVDMYRGLGMHDYAEEVQRVIEAMETQLSAPAQ